MNNSIKRYIDKLLTYLPVAIFMFTVVFYINLSFAIDEFKAEFGVNAIDELIKLFTFYFSRTILLTLFVPFYDVVLSTDKLSYLKAMIIHYLLIVVTVSVLFYQPGSPWQATLLMFGLCTLIYAIIRGTIYFREKHFVDDANKIFQSNKENS